MSHSVRGERGQLANNVELETPLRRAISSLSEPLGIKEEVIPLLSSSVWRVEARRWAWSSGGGRILS